MEKVSHVFGVTNAGWRFCPSYVLLGWWPPCNVLIAVRGVANVGDIGDVQPEEVKIRLSGLPAKNGYGLAVGRTPH